MALQLFSLRVSKLAELRRHFFFLGRRVIHAFPIRITWVFQGWEWFGCGGKIRTCYLFAALTKSTIAGQPANYRRPLSIMMSLCRVPRLE